METVSSYRIESVSIHWMHGLPQAPFVGKLKPHRCKLSDRPTWCVADGSIQPLGAEFSRRDDSDLEGSEADGPEGGGGSTVSEEFTR
jgi:hypothetical protein